MFNLNQAEFVLKIFGLKSYIFVHWIEIICTEINFLIEKEVGAPPWVAFHNVKAARNSYWSSVFWAA